MNYTNLHGLPQALVDAVMNDSYVGGGDISVTRLIDTPQRRVLERKHKNVLVEDVIERMLPTASLSEATRKQSLKNACT